MPEKGTIEVDKPNREDLGGIVDSIAAHPGLKTTTDEQGNEKPDDTWTQTQISDFYGTRTIGESAPPEQKASEPAEQTAQEAAAPEEPAQPTGAPSPAGHTRSVEEMERELQDLKDKVAQRNQENLALKAVNEHMEQLAQALRPPEQPQAPARIPIAFDEQNQPYVDPSIAQKMIDERVNALVTQRVQESLRPITSASNAYSRMKRDFPEFNQDEGRFSEWLATHPAYGERVAQDPESGMETAYLRYRYEAGQTQQHEHAETAAAAQAAVTSAQRHAAPAGGAATPQRRTTEMEVRQKRLDALYKHGQETGDMKPFIKARLEDAMGQSYLDTMERTSWGR